MGGPRYIAILVYGLRYILVNDYLFPANGSRSSVALFRHPIVLYNTSITLFVAISKVYSIGIASLGSTHMG
jgi:hypothetical protein